MTFQGSNFFFLVSSPLQWSSGSNIRIFNLPEEEWGVLSQAINNLKSSPEVQLCSFRDIIQKIFIFDLEFIWIQFSTLSFTRFLPSPCLPREVRELSNTSLILSWDRWLLFVQGMDTFFRHLLQSNYQTACAEWGCNELASIKLFKHAQTGQDKLW